MRLAGYIRVSRVGGRTGERFISPDVQRENIDRIAHAGGHVVVDYWTDLDQSGGRLERPALQDALAAVERGDADGIAVAYLSRLSRSVVDFFHVVRRLEQAGGELLVGDLGLDTSTAAGRLVRNLLAVLAQWELEQARERWDVARARAIGRGASVSSTPVGYDRTPEGRLAANADAQAIRDVFELRAAGASLGEAAAFLNERGVKPTKAARWAPQNVAALFKVRAYVGEARSGEYVNRDAHEQVVPASVWDAVQPGGHVVKPGAAYLLTGLARCASCGYSLKTRGHKTGATYSCRRQHGGGTCPAPAHVRVELLDEHVQAVFLEAVRDGFLARAHADQDTAAAREQLAAAEAELAAYRDTAAVAVIGADAFLEGLQHRQQAVDEAVRELAAHAGPAIPTIGAKQLADTWPSLSVEQRRVLLGAAIDVVAVGRRESRLAGLGERVRVFWRGEGPDDLPRSGRVGHIRPIPLELPADAGM